MSYFLSVLGLVLIIEGIPYFAFPEKMKALLEKLPQIPNSNLRAFGITAIIIGLVLIYLSRELL
jgi:uncharacterized protein YjeT (DUF2065 family)